MSKKLSKSEINSILQNTRKLTQETNALADEIFADVARGIRTEWKPTKGQNSNITYLWPGNIPT